MLCGVSGEVAQTPQRTEPLNHSTPLNRKHATNYGFKPSDENPIYSHATYTCCSRSLPGHKNVSSIFRLSPTRLQTSTPLRGRVFRVSSHMSIATLQYLLWISPQTRRMADGELQFTGNPRNSYGQHRRSCHSGVLFFSLQPVQVASHLSGLLACLATSVHSFPAAELSAASRR